MALNTSLVMSTSIAISPIMEQQDPSTGANNLTLPVSAQITCKPHRIFPLLYGNKMVWSDGVAINQEGDIIANIVRDQVISSSTVKENALLKSMFDVGHQVQIAYTDIEEDLGDYLWVGSKEENSKVMALLWLPTFEEDSDTKEDEEADETQYLLGMMESGRMIIWEMKKHDNIIIDKYNEPKVAALTKEAGKFVLLATDKYNGIKVAYISGEYIQVFDIYGDYTTIDRFSEITHSFPIIGAEPLNDTSLIFMDEKKEMHIYNWDDHVNNSKEDVIEDVDIEFAETIVADPRKCHFCRDHKKYIFCLQGHLLLGVDGQEEEESFQFSVSFNALVADEKEVITEDMIYVPEIGFVILYHLANSDYKLCYIKDKDLEEAIEKETKEGEKAPVVTAYPIVIVEKQPEENKKEESFSSFEENKSDTDQEDTDSDVSEEENSDPEDQNTPSSEAYQIKWLKQEKSFLLVLPNKEKTGTRTLELHDIKIGDKPFIKTTESSKVDSVQNLPQEVDRAQEPPQNRGILAVRQTSWKQEAMAIFVLCIICWWIVPSKNQQDWEEDYWGEDWGENWEEENFFF